MLEIASHPAEQGVFQKDIAENQEISIKYLDHIIRDLKVAGLLVNAKGKKAGMYSPARPKKLLFTIFFKHLNRQLSLWSVCRKPAPAPAKASAPAS